ncbi:MAG: disulfide bond formation protein B, partial [Gammaproteobacteria bacterium]|nr:disulfide bond formation protein B [Gammaproteobacteria bacterium]
MTKRSLSKLYTYYSRRLGNGLGFAACAVLMGYALFAQHVLDLAPCPLCVFQRLAVIGMGIVFLVIFLHNPKSWFRWIYVVIGTLIGIGGMLVAGRHIWLQNLPADKVPACGPGFDYLFDNFPLAEAMRAVFSGSGEC